MKILLLNSNPVVNKLVTLSAQKTNDSVDAYEDTEAIKMGGKYDLLIVDDSVYSAEAMDEVLSKIEYEKSLYICSRDANIPSEFDSATRKPFLPTDLVEQFAAFSKSMHLAKNDSMQSTQFQSSEPELDDLDGFDTIEELGELDDIEMLDTLIPEENKIKELEVFEDIKDDFDNFLEIEDDKEDKTSVLDKDELKEVQSLLDDTEDDDILDDDFEFENANKELSFDEEFDFDPEKDDVIVDKDELEELEDDLNFDIEEDIVEPVAKEVNLDDELFMDEEKEIEETSQESEEDFDFDIEDDVIANKGELEELEDELNLDIEEDMQEPVAQEMNLENDLVEDEVQEDFETQIQDAMSQLSQEDLDKELDDDILLELGSLTSKDLKLALGEEVDDVDSTQAFDSDILEDTLQDEIFEDNIEKEDGVEALKKLLEALTSKDVVASLAGKKININITIG